MGAPLDSLSLAVVQSATFVASLDIFPRGSLPLSIRGALVLTIAPLLLAANTAMATMTGGSFLVIGVAHCLLLGLGATMLGWGIRAAGGLIENALAPGLLAQGVFGGNGPLSRLYALGFAFVFLSSGSYAALVGALVSIPSAGAGLHLQPAARGLELMHAFSFAALALAGPALLAQAVAALIAGIVARVSPFVNGMLLSAPLAAGAVLITLVLAAPQMWAFAFQLSAKVASFGYGLAH